MKFTYIIVLGSMLLLPITSLAHSIPSFAGKSHNSQTADCSLCSPTQPILYEDGLTFIIEDKLSSLKTSLLIVPKKHITELRELNLDSRADQQLLTHLMSVAQMLASRLAGTQSYRITVTGGSELLHVPHLCIRFESDDMLQKA